MGKEALLRRGNGGWPDGLDGLGHGEVALLGDDGEIGPQHLDLDGAVLAIDERLVGVVADGVLGAYFLGDAGEAFLDAALTELIVDLSSGRISVGGEDVVAHEERQVHAIHKTHAGDGGIADEGGVDGDLVGLEIFDYILLLRSAAVLFAVADDVDDAAATFAGFGGCGSCHQDCVVEGVDLSGDLEGDTGRGAVGRRVGIDVIAVDGVRLPEGAGRVVVDGVASLALGALEDGAETGALGSGKVGLHLGPVVVGDDGNFVVGGECSGQGAEGVVDLGHDVEGHALVDDERDGEREGIDGEEIEVLTIAVLEDSDVAPGNTGDGLILGVLDGEGDFDEVDARTADGKYLRGLARGGDLGRGLVVGVGSDLGTGFQSGTGSVLLIIGVGGGGAGAPFESGVVPLPGVIAPLSGRVGWGRGASGMTCCWGASGNAAGFCCPAC